jgi:16S rRNA (guanine1207-N2)-methyltransferase
VRSAEQMLEGYAPLNKVDSARRCGLYHGRLEKQPTFDASILGRVSAGRSDHQNPAGRLQPRWLDVGSQLLLSP